MPSETKPAFSKQVLLFIKQAIRYYLSACLYKYKDKMRRQGCATDDIAQEYGNHVEEKLPPCDVCTCQNTRWDNEHIGDKVLEAV